MNTPAHYLVTTPALTFTWIGTAEPDGAFVWLCTPDGRRVLRAPKAYVRESTLEETAARIVADRRAVRAALN